MVFSTTLLTTTSRINIMRKICSLINSIDSRRRTTTLCKTFYYWLKSKLKSKMETAHYLTAEIMTIFSSNL